MSDFIIEKSNKYLQSPKENKHIDFLKLIKKRHDHNKDTRIIITGESGIGKSTLALKIALGVDPTYKNEIDYAIKNLVTFNTLEYMKAINSSREGTVLIMDEAGQAIHHREYMHSVNVILSKTMIGNRFKKLVQIFCVPTLEMVDKDCRNLVHYLIHVKSQGRAIIYRILVSRFGGRTMYRIVVDNLMFTKPEVKLWHRYELKKFKVQKELFEDFQKTIEEKGKVPISNIELLKRVRENPESYMRNEKFNVRSIQGLGIGRERAETIRSMLEKDFET